MSTTKILITGGAGFIGSNFIRHRLEHFSDDVITNLDALTYAGRLENVRDVEERFAGRYAFVKGNIGNAELVAHIFKTQKPDIVVNFAAESHNSRAILHPKVFYETNVLGVQCLLDSARAFGVRRFHHISTCEVYGDLALDSEERFTEESPYRPRTPYNASKASADMTVRAYYETFGIPISISNCANNYGPYQFPEKLIPHFTARAIRKEQLPLYKASKNRREWIHVDDHCRAIDLILERGMIGETYNVGTGVEADIETIADIILGEFALDQSHKVYVEDRPGHDRRYLLDSSKIRTKLGWVPSISFEDGIRETIHWYKEHTWWWKPLFEGLEIREGAWGKGGGK